MKSMNIDWTIVFFIVLFCVIANLIAVYKYLYKKTEEKVRNTSQRYKFIVDLPNVLNAYNLSEEYILLQCLKTKAQFDRAVFENQLMQYLESDESIEQIIKDGEYNKNKLIEFNRMIENLPPINDNQAGYLYKKLEIKLTNEEIKASEPIIPSFVFRLLYSSPKGRNSFKRDYQISLEEMKLYYSQFQDYNAKRKAEQESASYQRRIMSNSLRYDVMKRDGFRCVLCGKSAADGVEL